MSKKLCPIHGLYSTKSCIRCQSTKQRVYDKLYRDKEADKFYHSRAWKRVRGLKMKQNPICELCNQALADVVDHIVEIKDGGEKLKLSNLQSLCHSCHNKKTREERQKREGVCKSPQPKTPSTYTPSSLCVKTGLRG